MSFEKCRCMFNSEDNADEEYAVCLYPKCWIMECPHKQVRDRLVKAQELVEKWRRVEILANAEQVAIKMAHHKCADELDDALK